MGTGPPPGPAGLRAFHGLKVAIAACRLGSTCSRACRAPSAHFGSRWPRRAGPAFQQNRGWRASARPAGPHQPAHIAVWKTRSVPRALP